MNMRTLILTILAAATPALAAALGHGFTLVDMPQYQVRLHQAGEDVFEGVANGLLRPDWVRRLGRLRNQSVVLKNNSSKIIIGYSLSWVIQRTDGSTRTVKIAAVAIPALLDGNRRRYDAKTEGYTVIIPAHGRIISPILNIGEEPVEPVFPDDSKIKQLSEMLDAAEHITVRLDGVLFEDGTFCGPDPDNVFETFKQTVDAEQQIYSRILEEKQAGIADEEIREEMRAVASEAETLNAPPTAHTRTRALRSAEFLRMAETIGVERAVLVFANRAYRVPPTLRRID